jgi:hypothetical protein
MKTRSTRILVPQDLVREIDAIAGPKGRSAFVAEAAWEAVRRKKLLQFLESDAPAWKDADHRELAQSAAAWVRWLRRENEGHQEKRPGRAERSGLGRYFDADRICCIACFSGLPCSGKQFAALGSEAKYITSAWSTHDLGVSQEQHATAGNSEGIADRLS